MSESDEINDLSRRLGELISDRYELKELVGQGGMAYVFRARDVRHDRFVAIKVLQPDLASAIGGERFLREVQTTASFANPHILTLIDSGASGDILYYVMPFVEGESLRQKLSRETQLGLDDAMTIARDVASALSYAHERGVVHRDIKPENVLLLDGRALVTDFGIALAAGDVGDQRLTEKGLSLGTPAYMSPEQATGDLVVDTRSDVYSFGCVVYEMLTGEPPHRGATAGATISKMMTERPTAIRVVRDNVPRHVEAAVMRALAKVPGDRFQSIEKFIAALGDADATTSPVPSVSPSTSVWRRILTFVTIALLVIIAATVVIRSGRVSTGFANTVTRQLTFTGDAESVALSSDGTFVVYLTNQGRRLKVQDLDGGGELTLYESSEPMGPPKWNREGTRILFATSVGDDMGLFTIPRLGGVVTARARVGTPGTPSNYDFGSTDSTFAVACCRGKIYVGPDPSVVLNRSNRDANIPGTADVSRVADLVVELAISPNGRSIAFIGGFPNEATVVGVVALGDSQPTVVATREGSWFELERLPVGSLRWSPDNQLFFAENSGSSARVVAVSMNRRGVPTGEIRTVFPNIPAGSQFDVAPRSGRLVYAGGVERMRMEFVERGTPASRRLGTGTYKYRYPRISPDGEWVVYHRSSGDRVQFLVRRLPDGDSVLLLQEHRPLSPAVWAPTKPQVAVIATTGTVVSLHVIDVSTREQREIAQDVQPGRLLWTSSGEELTFMRRGVGWVTVRVSDGEEIAGPPLGNIAREFGSRRALADPSADTTGVPPSANRPNVLPDSPDLVVGQPIPPLVRAPDGDGFVAYSRGVAGLNGLVVVSADGSRRRITDTVAYPLVWNKEGTIFYVDDGVDGTGATHVHAISASGGPTRPWLDLPFSCSFANLTLSQNGDRAVCAFSDAVSDVWLINGIPDMSVR